MTDLEMMLYGHPIYLATREYQRRKHRKKRINKKWLKRYGCYELNTMPHGEAVLIDGALCMTKRTWQKLKEQIRSDEE